MKKPWYRTQKALDLLWAAGFCVCLAAMVYKCRFGFGNVDEAFYLTVPYRLCMGDGLFVHEYHLSQMSAVLLYPVMKLYLWLAGTTDGILLAFRYIFTALHSLTALFLYGRLRKGNPWAGAVSLLYLLFMPFGIMALSYNSMGLGLMCISAALIYGNDRGSRPAALASGAAFAGAVLCCPYLLLVYLYYGAAAAAAGRYDAALGKRVRRDFGYFTLACGVCAAAFLGFVLSRCSLSQLLGALEGIFSDPEHPGRSLLQVVWDYVMAVESSSAVAVPAALCAIGLLGAAVFRHSGRKHPRVFLLSGLGLAAVYLLPFLTVKQYLNFLMLPMVLVGLFCFAVYPEETRKEFLIFFVPGILYGFCLNWASNNGIYVIANGALLCTAGTLLMLKKLWNKLPGAGGRAFRWGALALVTVLMLSLFAQRMDQVFWDDRLSRGTLTEQIEVGANRGLVTTAEKKEMYTSLYRETEAVRQYPGEQVLYLSENTWLYLEDTKQNAAFSAWLSGVNDAASDRLVDYYGRNPGKLPDIVFCAREDFDPAYSLVEYLLGLGYRLEEQENAVLLYRQ